MSGYAVVYARDIDELINPYNQKNSCTYFTGEKVMEMELNWDAVEH